MTFTQNPDLTESPVVWSLPQTTLVLNTQDSAVENRCPGNRFLTLLQGHCLVTLGATVVPLSFVAQSIFSYFYVYEVPSLPIATHQMTTLTDS